MEEDDALSTGMAAWCAGDRVGDPVSDLSLTTFLNAKARNAISRGLNEGVDTISTPFSIPHCPKDSDETRSRPDVHDVARCVACCACPACRGNSQRQHEFPLYRLGSRHGRGVRRPC